MKGSETWTCSRVEDERCLFLIARTANRLPDSPKACSRILLGYNDTITFENKTICLVGRYPYWTEFRRFLTHLHLLSGSTSDIPIERNISHLLLAVPIPKPGGQCVLVPFSTMNEPMALSTPPLKDLPLVDLTYERLFAALDVPTVVTVVLGFLCLEKKVRSRSASNLEL